MFYPLSRNRRFGGPYDKPSRAISVIRVHGEDRFLRSHFITADFPGSIEKSMFVDVEVVAIAARNQMGI